jgi:predicted amidohydrolase YtcJ
MMIQRRAAALLFLAFTACTMPNNKPEASAPEVIYAGGTVLAGPEQTPQANWSVVTSKGVIVAAGPAEAMRTAHPGAKVVDVHGTTVMPGLTDAHGHL